MIQKAPEQAILGIAGTPPPSVRERLLLSDFKLFENAPEIIDRHRALLNGESEGKTAQQIATICFRRLIERSPHDRTAVMGLSAEHVESFRRAGGAVIAFALPGEPLVERPTDTKLPRLFTIEALNGSEDAMRRFSSIVLDITS